MYMGIANIFENQNDFAESKRENLELQYDNPEKIKTGLGEMIEVVDIKPENAKTDVPASYLKGFASDNRAYRNLAIDLAMNDRRVIAIDNPHGIDSEHIAEEEKIKAGRQMEKLHDIELRKTAMLLEMLDKKEIKKTDIVAHSEGAIYAVVAALMRPEKIRDIVLIEPAGIIGNDNRPSLAARSVWDAVLQEKNIKTMRKGKDSREKYHPDDKKSPSIIEKMGEEASKNAKMQTISWAESWKTGLGHNIGAIKAIADTDISQALRFLREECQIKIGIIHAVDDKIFPMEPVRENLSKDMVDGSYSTVGTHASFTHNPGKYAKLIDDLLRGMERKRTKNDAQK